MTTQAATSDAGGSGAASGGGVHATRLESLLLLVRNGSSAQIRENAAEQLGEVAVQSPASCRAIVQHVRELVADPEWDVRVAASKCLEVVARALRSQRARLVSAFAAASLDSGEDALGAALTFETVDIHRVVRDGAPLLRSGGEEYQYETNLSPEQRRLQALKQRRLLLWRISGSTEPIWTTREDSLTQQMLPRLNATHVKDIADDIERGETHELAPAVPVQQKKRAAAELLETERRRRRLTAPSASAADKKIKTEHGETMGPATADPTSSGEDADQLAQLQIVAELVADLFESVFNAKWEVRHGALLALRQLFLSAQLTQSLATCNSDNDKSVRRMHKWLEECLVRCICVLALDQFADYSADGSVSPVREVCAQVFGVLLGNLQSDARLLVGYLEVLRALFRGSTWHACHGALLGLKYLVLAHRSHAPTLLPLFFRDVLDAFASRQTEDDVLVLAAEMFEVFTPYLAQTPAAQLQEAATLLWTALESHAALGLVPACVVRALSAWYTHAPVRAALDADAALAALTAASLRHIVPLLHQPLQAVRQAAVMCAAAMFRDDERAVRLPDLPFIRYLLPHLLLQLLRETERELRTDVFDAWKRVVHASARANQLVAAIGDDLATWTELLWSAAEVDLLVVRYNRSDDGSECDDDGGDTQSCTDSAAADVEGNSASRVAFADAIGYLAAHIPFETSPRDALVKRLSENVQSASGERQCGALLTIARWAFYEKANASGQDAATASCRVLALQAALGATLEALARADWVVPCHDRGEIYYTEQRGLLKRVRIMEARILEVFAANSVVCAPASSDFVSAAATSRRIAESVASLPYARLAAQPQAFELAHFKRQDLFLLDDALQQSAAQFYHRVQGLGSCAFSNLLAVPTKKSGFLVKALMDALKQEANGDFQRLVARTVADFVVSQAHVQRKCVAKIVSNLCNSAVALAFTETNDDGGDADADASDDGVDVSACAATVIAPDVLQRARVRVSGAESTLKTICAVAGARVVELCPSLNDAVARAWAASPRDDQIVQQSAHLVQTLVASIDPQAFDTCLNWLREFAALVTLPLRLGATRAAVARAIASICCQAATPHRDSAMALLYEHVFAVFNVSGALPASERHDALLGALLVLHHVVRALASELTPFIPSLVHYAMKTMSLQSTKIRSFAARVFAELVPLVPLQMDLQPVSPPASLRAIVGANQVSRAFLQSLLEGKAVRRVDVAHVLAPGVTLRTYQQHGVDWIAFLAENSLHGILADDMGLGKTLQTLAAMAAWLDSGKRDAADAHTPSPCCLIVCPPVVTNHWVTEARVRLARAFAHVIDYSGTPAERKALRKTLDTARTPSPSSSSVTAAAATGPLLVVTTYAALRADIAFLKQIDFAFAVLDEAHLIRNPSTSLFAAVQQLSATHRVALSGTPLQNNVADLWSLFEFLMPGYLGAAVTFRREYVLPISRSRERNATPKQKEAAALAIARLHQRVLPFILRRTKSQVLQELPPKIVSNVLAAMTPVQHKLYAWACGSDRAAAGSDASTASVLANLHLLRRICVHPSLVALDAVAQQLSAKEAKAATQWDSSGKFVALRDLLVDACDLGGREASAAASASSDAVSSPHRVLIFAQLKETLDVVERMFVSALPRITYRRLDGRTAPNQRAAVVQQFNDDVSIDVLLLTTAIGGLGLTLTGADTVIFLEHSWNPFVDLQAMDRAHRIGQRRTVRVFRVIVRASLEEHIMDLQAFKERVATTVVGENDARRSMGASTTEVLRLLQTSSSTLSASSLKTAVSESSEASEHMAYLPAGAQALLGQLSELWDESQYGSLAFPDDFEQ